MKFLCDLWLTSLLTSWPVALTLLLWVMKLTPHTREQSFPPEEVLRASEVTQGFTISAAVDSHSLFLTAPDTSGREVVRTDDSWSRPGAYMERFAVFVDGVAAKGNRSGVLGHAGFPYMCVLCGDFFPM